MNCDALSLVSAATGLQGIPPGMKLDVLIALFCQMAGVPCDAQSLTKLGQCNLCNLPAGTKWDILIALFCQWSNGQSSPVLAAPTLTAINAFLASWTWTGTNPAAWLIESSPDNGLTWNQIFSVAGSSRSFIQNIPNGLYSIIGVDGSNNAVTARSNTLSF